MGYKDCLRSGRVQETGTATVQVGKKKSAEL